jgi:glycosyltransferase involved in cell wall biosynthesis
MTNSPPISVCALVPYPVNTTPSQRFRIEQWKPYLEREGIKIDFYPFADEKLLRQLHKPGTQMGKAFGMLKAFARSAGNVFKSKQCDAVYIHRAICIAGPAILERVLSLSNRPIIFDFDDSIWLLHTTAANRFFGWLKFPGKTKTICRLSNHVVVGNSYLADYAREFNSKVTVVPTSVDVERYKMSALKKTHDKIVIGWTGSSTSQTYLEMFDDVLRELIKRRDVEIRVHSDREPKLPGVPYVWRSWSAETEIEELSQFDIGIMPMPDDKWARGKCAMKALLYMAMDTPAICTAIGANRELIQHGENGLLALTKDEWLNCFEALIDNAELRMKLGTAGRQTVVKNYSAESCAAMFADVVKQVAR